MKDAVREMFAVLANAESPAGPLAARLEGTYRFDIEGAGSFHVRFAGGKAIVRESRDKADCLLTMAPEEFVGLAMGQLNLMTSLLQGRVQAEGNLALAEAMNSFLRYLQQRRSELSAEETRP
jgi:putative sterol carrier protein